MRKLFIEESDLQDLCTSCECCTLKAADMIAPWACAFEYAHGGIWAFESVVDHELWKNQK